MRSQKCRTPWNATIGKRSQNIGLTKLLVGLGLGLVAFFTASCMKTENDNSIDSKPGSKSTLVLPEFVGKEACIQCHEAEYQAWTGSDHAKSMDHANDSTVLGHFNGDSLVVHGITSKFYRKEGKFMVLTEGVAGKLAEFEIKFTFGIRPLQQYLVEFPKGRLQALPLAWDTHNSHWFHLQPDQKIAPDDWLHWTKDGQNWNGMCADCHSTGLRRNYQAHDGSFKTTWNEINVSCEACHGPGSVHVKQARSGKLSQWFSGYSKKNNFGLITHFTDTASRGASMSAFLNPSQKDHLSSSHPPEIEACAPCHARRGALKPEYGYQKKFLDEYLPELLHENVYHADGQFQSENFEYGSFTQSKMFQKGVGCSDCHNAHTLKVKAVDNALCTRCHEASKFDAVSHHRHQSSSQGSLCVNCHMPTKAYMVLDIRRDHSLRVPRPDLSQIYGTPNACNNCHANKPASWAADWVAKWHGPTRKTNFADLLALGRSGKPGSVEALQGLAEDSIHPAIARATAMSLLANYLNPYVVPTLLNGAKNPDPLIRVAATSAIEYLPEADRIASLAPRLTDSILAIRIAAAQALASISPLLPDSLRTVFASALSEARTALASSAYFPSGRFNLGQLHEKQGVLDSAVLEYKASLELDNRFVPARMNLAQLLDRMGRKGEAEFQFRESFHYNPDFGDAYYSLGLLFAEAGKLDSAARYLELAGQKLPGNTRVHYNLALVYQKLNQLPKAITTIQKGLQLMGEDPDFLYTLAWLQSLARKWKDSEKTLSRLVAIAPQYPGLSGLMQEVKENQGR